MREVLDMIRLVADSCATVLIQGESGTGKELVAKTIHQTSYRRDKPFVVVDCGSLPETLLESELFGHVKGSFTGAHATKRGLFEEADGGTIFLDEIADTTATFQSKLLRVLQEGEIKRVGGNQPIKIDVRVVSATNRDLVELVKAKSFRQDLCRCLFLRSVTGEKISRSWYSISWRRPASATGSQSGRSRRM